MTLLPPSYGWSGLDGRILHIVLKTHGMSFWLENLKARDHLEDLSIDGKVLEWILGKYGGKVWTEYIWLRIGTGGGLL